MKTFHEFYQEMDSQPLTEMNIDPSDPMVQAAAKAVTDALQGWTDAAAPLAGGAGAAVGLYYFLKDKIIEWKLSREHEQAKKNYVPYDGPYDKKT
jgi:hypothetical protein